MFRQRLPLNVPCILPMMLSHRNFSSAVLGLIQETFLVLCGSIYTNQTSSPLTQSAETNIFFVIIIHLFANLSENSCCPHRTVVSVENNFVKILCSRSRLKYIFVVRLMADPMSLRIISISLYFLLQWSKLLFLWFSYVYHVRILWKKDFELFILDW